MKSYRPPIVLLLIGLCLGAVPFAAAQVLYTLTDIGSSFGAVNNTALGINNSGQIVGASGSGGYGSSYGYRQGPFAPMGMQQSGGIQHGFLYSGGTITTLSPESYLSIGLAINDSGEIAGMSMANANVAYQATTWQNGTATTNWGGAIANSINNAGQIGVVNSIGNGGFVASGSGTTALPVGNRPLAINSSGQTAGSIIGSYAPYVSNGSSYTNLAVPNNGSGYAIGLNDAGIAVGYGYVSYLTNHALVWSSNGTVTDIAPTTPGYNSYAFDVNNQGQVVGGSDTNGAFVYSSGTLTYLNSVVDFTGSGITTLYQANAINDLGQIVGVGLGADGYQTAFLLTPIPEPSTYAALAGLGALGLAFWRRRRLAAAA